MDFIASTANIRVDVKQIETRYGTDVKKDANVGSKNGTGHVKEPVPVVGVDLLPALLLQAEGNLHQDSSFLLAFDLVWRVRQLISPKKHAS
jgi:hypothetical protein